MAKYPSLGNHHFFCPPFFQVRTVFRVKKKKKLLVQMAAQPIAPMLFFKTTTGPQCAEKVFYAFFPVNDNTLNRQAIKW